MSRNKQDVHQRGKNASVLTFTSKGPCWSSTSSSNCSNYRWLSRMTSLTTTQPAAPSAGSTNPSQGITSISGARRTRSCTALAQGEKWTRRTFSYLNPLQRHLAPQ
eukprot:9486681-Pyramimonas_sp.AAC.1